MDNMLDTGTLKVSLRSTLGSIPVKSAQVAISYTGEPDSTIETLSTDSSGQTETITLPTPPLEYSMSPSENQPYSEYTLQVKAEGYEPVSVSGVELFSGQEALADIDMVPNTAGENPERFVIGPHTLFGDYPPKIPEEEVKPPTESGEIVLSRVVVPEYIIVHDGPPSDSSASDYFVPFTDYIKNVASSEIYATWPASTIRANVLAILSFTLNRVYTEW